MNKKHGDDIHKGRRGNGQERGVRIEFGGIGEVTELIVGIKGDEKTDQGNPNEGVSLGTVCFLFRGRRLGWRCGMGRGASEGQGGDKGDFGAVCDEAMAACWGTKETVLMVVILSLADGFR